MPVFVINADPSFDLPGIARREGLDLFRDERVKLIDALRKPANPQIERLWNEWPTCLEENKNNLRAEIDDIVDSAAAQPSVSHVILLVVDRFALADGRI